MAYLLQILPTSGDILGAKNADGATVLHVAARNKSTKAAAEVKAHRESQVSQCAVQLIRLTKERHEESSVVNACDQVS